MLDRPAKGRIDRKVKIRMALGEEGRTPLRHWAQQEFSRLMNPKKDIGNQKIKKSLDFF